jgi:hypothetical protein
VPTLISPVLAMWPEPRLWTSLALLKCYVSAKRRLCNTVGGRIGRAKACAAYRCAVTAARSLAATSNNLARVSRTLVLRALFGGPKSCALVNLFMICPRGGE